MIVLISDGAMAKRDVILHENHYGGPTQERLIQSKLLAADDRLEKEFIIRLIENTSKPKTTRIIKERSEELTGWNHNSKILLRKPEKESLNAKGREGQRESLSWRDSRLKLPNPRDNFVFKHYQDIRYYIKQYREEHSNLDNSAPQPPKRVSAFYNSGYYNVAPQPVNREYTNAQILARITQNIHQNGHQNGTFQYTRREHTKTDLRKDCSKSEKPPSGMVHKYKLVPNVTPADSESSSECDIKVGSRPRKNSNGSKSSSSTPVKSPTKVCVPCTNNPSSVSTKLSSNGVTGCPGGQQVKLEVSSNGSRTLDTLACVAAQEGQPDTSEVVTTSSNSETSEVSIGKLSTTCLGAAASVKQPPKLEASCTYHIYPAKNLISSSGAAGVSSTMMWNPQKSSFERKPVKGNEREAGMNSPFRKSRSPNIKLMSVIRKDKTTRAKQAKEGPSETFPLLPNKLSKGGLGREKTLALMEAKRELEGSEKEPVLKVQSLKSHGRSHSTIGYDEIKKEKKLKSVRTPTQKYCATALEPRIGSAGNTPDLDVSPPGLHYAPKDCVRMETGSDEESVPYFRFWNNGINRRHLTHSGKKKRWCVDSDIDLKHLTELSILQPEIGNCDLDLSSEKRLQGPPVASGIHVSARTLDGLTWREKLEVLRQINKPRERSRRPPLRLTFFKADAECEMIGRDHMSHDPMSHDQLSQQRRIKHLIEQTRLKFTPRHPPDFVTSRSKYWANDPDSELDSHLNISRPKFTFSKRDGYSNTPRRVLLASDLSDDTDPGTVQYRLSALENPRLQTNTVPSLSWQTAANQCAAPDMTPRSYTCIYPGDSI